jgi:hypothetical protein
MGRRPKPGLTFTGTDDALEIKQGSLEQAPRNTKVIRVSDETYEVLSTLASTLGFTVGRVADALIKQAAFDPQL